MGATVDSYGLKLVSQRTTGTSTCVAIKADDGKEFNCIVNGAKWAIFGAASPPPIARKN